MTRLLLRRSRRHGRSHRAARLGDPALLGLDLDQAPLPACTDDAQRGATNE